MINCSALLAVLYHLREDVAKLFDQHNNKHQKILCTGADINLDDVNLLKALTGDSFAVMVEDCHIPFTPDLIHVFGIMIALHYVFNLSYAALTQPTMVFILILILNLADNYRTSIKVLNLIAKSEKIIIWINF